MHYVFIVSDGSGRTAEQTLQAALTQFRDTVVTFERRSEVRTRKQAIAVVEEAAEVRGFIVYTVVSKGLRDAIGELCRLYDVDSVDLMGPLLGRLAERFASSPAERPGLFRQLNKEYFRRIEAMEFAFRHDDGQRVEELRKAEIVLVGVSRTFKTPLSVYLAFRGWLVANVPVVLGLPVPAILSQLPPERVFGLKTNAHRLAALRRVRDEHLGGAAGEYAHLDHVRRELACARDLFRRHPGWTVVEVTDKPIEEIASEILAAKRQGPSAVPVLGGG
jgi:regulator of PEP synthase PpsR (kinase-PPPase family)